MRNHQPTSRKSDNLCHGPGARLADQEPHHADPPAGSALRPTETISTRFSVRVRSVFQVSFSGRLLAGANDPLGRPPGGVQRREFPGQAALTGGWLNRPRACPCSSMPVRGGSAPWVWQVCHKGAGLTIAVFSCAILACGSRLQVTNLPPNPAAGKFARFVAACPRPARRDRPAPHPGALHGRTRTRGQLVCHFRRKRIDQAKAPFLSAWRVSNRVSLSRTNSKSCEKSARSSSSFTRGGP